MMHPAHFQEIARDRQTDRLGEAERDRLAYLATHDDDAPRRTFRFHLRRARTASLSRAALD